jgi:MFS family permease
MEEEYTHARGAPRRLSTFAALRHRNFSLWFIGQTISLCGTWMQSIAQGWLVYEITGSNLALGVVSFAGTIPTLFLMLPAGVLADRIPKRRLLVITQTTMMILAFILALLTAFHVVQVWHILLLATGLGIANSFDAPTRQSLVVEMVDDRRDLMNAIALNSTIFNLARVVGPAIGGIVLALAGATWCFALNGISFVAVIISLLMMRIKPHLAPAQHKSMWADIADGLKYVRSYRPTLILMLLAAVSSLFAFSFSTLMPSIAVTLLNVGETGLGALNAAIGIGALCASLIIASLSQMSGKGRLLTFGSLVFPTALILLSTSRNYSLSLVLLVVIGLGFVTQNATINTLIQSSTPDELRGRVLSLYTLMFFGMTPFGALQAGTIANWLGPAAGVAVGACISLLFALGIVVFAPQMRKL